MLIKLHPNPTVTNTSEALYLQAQLWQRKVDASVAFTTLFVHVLILFYQTISLIVA